MAITQAVLLTGGLAKRLGPITSVTNKHLLPVYDKPMVYHGLYLLKYIGIENVTIVLGGNSVGDIVNLIKDGSEFGLHVTYVFQKEPKGISQAILLAEKTLSPGKFLVLLGDNIFGNSEELKQGVELFDTPAKDCLVFMQGSKEPQNYGQPIFDRNGRVVGFAEKLEKPLHNLIVVGLYGFPDDVFDIIREQQPSKRGELEITDTLNGYVNFIESHDYAGFWTDCGTPEGLVEASLWLKERDGNVKVS